MLKRYLCGRRITDTNSNNLFLNNKSLWEYRYKLQYEEPRVKVVSGGDGSGNGILLLTWKRSY
jgi:hypothetical protein